MRAIALAQAQDSTAQAKHWQGKAKLGHRHRHRHKHRPDGPEAELSAIFITISYESKVKLNGEPIISVSTGRNETRRFQRKDSAISAVTGR